MRSIYELVAFITDGTVIIQDQTRRFWRSEVFSEDDLYEYLVRDILHGPQFESMVRRVKTYRLGTAVVHVETFVLDTLQSAARLGFDVDRLLPGNRL